MKKKILLIFAILDNNGVMDVDIAFFVLLFLLIVLGLSFFLFKRRVNKIARNLVDIDKKATDKIEAIDTIFEMLPTGVWVLSAEGFLIEINKRGLELMGVPDKDLVKGLPFESSPILPESIKEAFRKREAIHTNFAYDFSKVRKLNYYKTSRDSETIQVDFKGKPIFNSCGKFEKYIFIISDVTEMHNKEQMLTETQLNLSLAIEIGEISVWGYNVASKCFYNICGKTFEDDKVSFEERYALIHPDERDEHMNIINKILTGEMLNASVSYRLMNTNTNEYEYLRSDMSIVLSEDGTIDRIVGARRNITEEVLSKQKIEEAMLYMKLSIQATGMVAWCIEKDSLYIFKNNSFIEMDYTISSLLDNVHPEDRKDYLNMYNAVLSDNYISDNTCDSGVFRIYDELINDYHYYECNIRPDRDSNGKVCRIFGGHYNITERRKKEDAINNMRKCLNMAMQASNILAWTEDLRTNKIKIIYGSIKELCCDDEGSCISSIHHKDVDIYNNYRDKIVAGAKNEVPILIYIKKGDGYGYFECILSLLYDEKGEQTHLIGSLKDLTEINNLNETLNNLYNESQVLLQSLPVGVAVFDEGCRQEYLNDALAQIFGIDDIETHLEKRLNLLEDPMLSIDVIKKLENGEDMDKIIEYDLGKANDTEFFTTRYKNKIYFDAKVRCVKDSNKNIIKYILIVSDVTEKHISRLVLEDSERNLKLAFKAGNVEAWSYDVKSKVFYSLGVDCPFEKEPLTLEDDNILIHPDDLKIKMDIINDISQGKTDNGQAIIRYKPTDIHDKYHYYDTHMIAKKENGVVVTIAFAQKDITDDYLHEIEREYSQQRIEFAIGSAELALWEYDVIKQVFTLQNDAIIGLGSAESLSVDDYCKHLNVDKTSDIEFRKIISYMNEGIDKSYSIDVRINPKSTDVYKWMYCTIGGSSFEKDEDGRVIKYVGFIKDNTKWIALNDMLVEINTQLKTVLDVGDIVPFICDIKKGKFYFSAPISENRTFFMDVNTELTLDKVLMFFHPEDREKMRDIAMSIVKGDISEFHNEIRWNTESLHDKIYEMNLSALRDEDFKGSLKIVGYLQDITERKQMISDLKKAKLEAEKSVVLKSAFLANMSHEIRTPLNAIIGFSELLANEDNDERKAEFMGIISTNNALLLKLINDVLDLSKIDAGFIEINVSIFDFSQFFNELYLSMQQRITNPIVKLSVTNPYSKCIVELDKNRLAQVCINYITNAIKYTPKGFIDMGYECVNGALRLYVKDTGIGIADNNKHKLFQRFEKFDDFAQGTGLGLSITKALVESMKGEVGFESKEGSGSTFWAWIPCSSILTDDDIITNNSIMESHDTDGVSEKSDMV